MFRGGFRSATLETFALLAGIFCLAMAFDLQDGILLLGDVDDRLRALQIRQLLSGKGWFDLTISGIAMPQPYVSPWSRLIDGPYAAIAWSLSQVMATDRAVSIAFQIWPPALMLAFAGLSAGCMRKLMPEGARPASLHVIVAALAMSYAALEFAPGRIDHHNAQLVTLAAAAYGTLCWSAAGGVWLAVALTVSATIGLETLPLICTLWGALTLAWITRRPGAQEIFRAFSAVMAVLLPLATLVFSGPDVLFGVHNDIVSAPYVAAFAGFGLISAAAASFLPAVASIPLRLVSLAIPGSLLLFLIAVAMPGVLAGPYEIIDPLSRDLWLDHVAQEQSALLLLRMGLPFATFNLALQAVVILGAGMLAWKGLRAGQSAPAVVLAMGVAAFLANLEAFRFIRFPAALLPIFIPQLLAHFSSLPVDKQKRMGIRFAGAALAAGGIFQIIAVAMPVQREPDALDAADFLMNDTCSAADRKAMTSLPAGRYMVTPMVGLTILEQAGRGVEIAALSFHRASPGLRRMFEAFYLSEPHTRREVLAPFDYLAFCTYPAALKALFSAPEGSLFEALLNDGPGEAFVPKPVAGSQYLKLFAIDHNRL